MPLSPFATEDVFARAVRALADRSGEQRGWYLARNIMNVMGLTPQQYGYGSDMALHNAVWTVVKQAVAASSAGLAFRPGSTIAPTPPKIPGIPAGQPDFRYRVVIEVTDPMGRKARTAVDVRDDNPLTYNDVRQRAGEIVANNTPREGDTPGKRRISEMTDYVVSGAIIILAGRRA